MIGSAEHAPWASVRPARVREEVTFGGSAERRARVLIDLAPLRRSRDLRLSVLGELVSVLGTQLTTVAVPYQVYQLTHSSLDVGLWPGCCRASVSSGRRSDPGSKNGLTGLVRLSEPG